MNGISCGAYKTVKPFNPIVKVMAVGNSTASLRATAITARFLAFFPPRPQIRSPKRRKSLSLPLVPKYIALLSSYA